jgi:hypothetical protein
MWAKKSTALGVCLMLGLITVVLMTGNTHSAEQQQPPSPSARDVPPGNAQQAPAPVTLKKVSREDGLVLGNGVSLDCIHPAKVSPFLNPRAREILSDPTVSFSLFIATTSRSADALTGVNVAAKARVLFASADANLELARNTSISEESFRLILVGEAEYGHDELRDPVLKPEAAKLIAAGEMKKFAEIYGTHHVRREHKIARIVLEVGIDRWSEATQNQLRAELKGGVSLPLVGGQLEVRIREDLKAASARGALSVNVKTVGGKALDAFADPVKAMVTKNPDLGAVGDLVKGLLKGFTRANSGIGAVTVAPYTEFGWEPNKVDLWDDLFERKLVGCADRYYRGRQVERDIGLALRNAQPQLAGQLKQYAGEYGRYFEQLAEFQAELLKKNREFAKKEYPKEPEIDSDTARGLLARFTTLDSRIAQLTSQVDRAGVIQIVSAEYVNGKLKGSVPANIIVQKEGGVLLATFDNNVLDATAFWGGGVAEGPVNQGRFLYRWAYLPVTANKQGKSVSIQVAGAIDSKEGRPLEKRVSGVSPSELPSRLRAAGSKLSSWLADCAKQYDGRFA